MLAQLHFHRFLALMFICLPGIKMNELYSQSTKTQFFDPKYMILKNSMVHSDTLTYRVLKDSPIRIIRTSGDTMFVEFRKILNDKPGDHDFLKIEEHSPVLYLLLDDGMDKIKFTDFDFSPLIIPLKIRPAMANNPMQFVGDVAIGPYFGYQIGSKSFDTPTKYTQIAMTFCAFGSPTMINLNPSNQDSASAMSNSILGISAGAGILFDINNLQFGLVTGWDWISGDASQTWIYQGKLWTSFSFAYNLSNQ